MQQAVDATQIDEGAGFGDVLDDALDGVAFDLGASSMPLGEAIEHEAQAQAICMQTGDFKRAYDAFVRKEKPEFLGT